MTAAALLTAGCFGSSTSNPHGPDESASTTPRSVTPVSIPSGTCPLSLPNGRMPPGVNDVGANHGNGKMWTTMWPHNVLIATPDYIEADGSVWMKWPWWWRRRFGRELAITGRRLNGDAPPLTAYVPDGYEVGFAPSGITFPREGCWEVTGRVGEASLTFVTLVLKAARYCPAEEH
jgi:hypothetical protein